MKLFIVCTLAAYPLIVEAQANITVYENIDQYIGHIKSDTGQKVTALYDGAIQRSRIGLRGVETFAGRYQATFLLEGGFNADNGTLGDSSRLFDRQAWLGLNTPEGEFRAGRQNTQIQAVGSAIDYTERATFGSVINSFGVPSRYDNDIAYFSPRFAGLQLVLHYALGETVGGGISGSAIYQVGLDWANGPYRAGYAGLAAKPLASGPIQTRVQYHNLYATYNYSRGTVYFAFVRSNNVTAASDDGVVTNSGETILNHAGTPGNTFPGTNADAGRFYHVYQISADYLVTPLLRIGVLYGLIRDQSSAENDAYGGNVGAYYDLSKHTTLYGFANYMVNRNNAGFRFSGSAAPVPNLAGANVNGRRITGYQVGILHRF